MSYPCINCGKEEEGEWFYGGKYYCDECIKPSELWCEIEHQY